MNGISGLKKKICGSKLPSPKLVISFLFAYPFFYNFSSILQFLKFSFCSFYLIFFLFSNFQVFKFIGSFLIFFSTHHFFFQISYFTIHFFKYVVFFTFFLKTNFSFFLLPKKYPCNDNDNQVSFPQLSKVPD